MDPKGFGPFFWYTYRYPDGLDAPLVNRQGSCREVEAPFRHGRSTLYRLPRSRWALVAGSWEGQYTSEVAALEQALKVHPADADLEDIREWR